MPCRASYIVVAVVSTPNALCVARWKRFNLLNSTANTVFAALVRGPDLPATVVRGGG